jgi:hypothetical protein
MSNRKENEMNELTKIDFHGAELLAVAGETPETTMVAMRPLVEGMGLDWKTQFRKLQGHPVLNEGVGIMTIPSLGGSQESVALPLNRVNYWLATIHTNRIPNAEIRAKVLDYQRECADALFAHFFGQLVQMSALETRFEARLAEMEARLIDIAENFDQARDSSIAFVRMNVVLDQEKVPSKGRRGLTIKCSNRARDLAKRLNRDKEWRFSRETGKLLFHVDFIKDWLAIEGNTIIRQHRDKLAGQTVLVFDASRKPKERSLDPLDPIVK